MGITVKTKTGRKKRTAKPSAERIAKHVAIAKRLAAKNHGKLPSYTWLDKNGYFPTYEILRLHTKNFGGIPRANRNHKPANQTRKFGERLKESFAA